MACALHTFSECVQQITMRYIKFVSIAHQIKDELRLLDLTILSRLEI